MLGPWIAAARATASGQGAAKQAEQDVLEFNARNQITEWGPGSRDSLHDYARKQWGGLVATYHVGQGGAGGAGGRWGATLDEMVSAVGAPGGGRAYNGTKVGAAVVAHEDAWQVRKRGVEEREGEGRERNEREKDYRIRYCCQEKHILSKELEYILCILTHVTPTDELQPDVPGGPPGRRRASIYEAPPQVLSAAAGGRCGGHCGEWGGDWVCAAAGDMEQGRGQPAVPVRPAIVVQPTVVK